jgi:hypothetical protein
MRWMASMGWRGAGFSAAGERQGQWTQLVREMERGWQVREGMSIEITTTSMEASQSNSKQSHAFVGQAGEGVGPHVGACFLPG